MNPQNPIAPVPQPQIPSVQPLVQTQVQPIPKPYTQPQTQAVPLSPTTNLNYAGFWTRYWAVLLDGVIMGVCAGLLSIPFSIASSMLGNAPQGQPNVGFLALTGISQLISAFIYIAYPIYFIGKKGATPGKNILKIKVVKVDSPNEEIGYLGAFTREIVGKLLSSFLLLGYLTMPKDKNKQTWHDKIAKTVVIKV